MLSWVEGSSGELLIFREATLLRRDVMEATGVMSEQVWAERPRWSRRQDLSDADGVCWSLWPQTEGTVLESLGWLLAEAADEAGHRLRLDLRRIIVALKQAHGSTGLLPGLLLEQCKDTVSAGLFAETASPVHWGWVCVTPPGGLRPQGPLPDTGPSAYPPLCVLLRAPKA